MGLVNNGVRPTGFGYVGTHHQPDLSAGLPQFSRQHGAASAALDLMGAENMLAEKFMLFLEALISVNKRDYPDGAPRVVSTSPLIPVKLPCLK
jgi:hypothetical protein